MTVKEIIKKEIDRLPEEILLEIFDFMQFLELKREKTTLVKNHQSLSEASLKKIRKIF